jgi:cytidine deaminase
MKAFQLNIQYTECDSIDELEPQDANLLEMAHKSAHLAYAPYSNFFVGAALKLNNGEIVVANNQENVAFPSGLCAERVAVFYAGATYPNAVVETIAISCQSKSFAVNEPLSPCGACRQALSEYEMKQTKPIRVILQGETGKIRIVNSIADLLPFMFKAEALKK